MARGPAKTSSSGRGGTKTAAARRKTGGGTGPRRKRKAVSKTPPLSQRLFVGFMRLSLACAAIFGIGLILGLYFSQTPPSAPEAKEAWIQEPPRAYHLSPVPQPPKIKPEQTAAAVSPPVLQSKPEARPDQTAANASTSDKERKPQVSAATPPAAAVMPAPDVPAAEVKQAAWLQNAVTSDASFDKPWIAIVLDDVGLNHRAAWEAIELPAPLTLAFMTYADDLPRMTRQARLQGHELMVHFPMEPSDLQRNDPGENALLLGLSQSETKRRLDWGLARFDGYVGVNNHMGSRYTENAEALQPVMAALKQRGLLFLDSRTSSQTVAGQVARGAGVPLASRDVFLDHIPTSAFVREQLTELEAVAQRRGYAVGIGHPHGYTMDVLRDWLPQAKARGFEIVPLTAIVKRRGEVG